MAHDKKKSSAEEQQNHQNTHMTNIPYQVPASKVSTV